MHFFTQRTEIFWEGGAGSGLKSAELRGGLKSAELRGGLKPAELRGGLKPALLKSPQKTYLCQNPPQKNTKYMSELAKKLIEKEKQERTGFLDQGLPSELRVLESGNIVLV